jgi:hypothetical protein
VALLVVRKATGSGRPLVSAPSVLLTAADGSEELHQVVIAHADPFVAHPVGGELALADPAPNSGDMDGQEPGRLRNGDKPVDCAGTNDASRYIHMCSYDSRVGPRS